MAKLSAGGRFEVARAVSEYIPEAGVFHGDNVMLSRTEERLMSDNKVLTKSTLTYKNGSSHNWGWSVKSTLKPGFGVEAWVEAKQRRGMVAHRVT